MTNIAVIYIQHPADKRPDWKGIHAFDPSYFIDVGIDADTADWEKIEKIEKEAKKFGLAWCCRDLGAHHPYASTRIKFSKEQWQTVLPKFEEALKKLLNSFNTGQDRYVLSKGASDGSASATISTELSALSPKLTTAAKSASKESATALSVKPSHHKSASCPVVGTADTPFLPPKSPKIRAKIAESLRRDAELRQQEDAAKIAAFHQREEASRSDFACGKVGKAKCSLLGRFVKLLPKCFRGKSGDCFEVASSHSEDASKTSLLTR